jgi:hypothetical protein
LDVAASQDEIESETTLRASFVAKRLGHRPDQLEAMDLTYFMHGVPGQLLRCDVCGTLLREENRAAHYESDIYDFALMKHLYPRYLDAFREKEAHYRNLLREHAEVVEVGSHLGAFLETAENWGWRPTGLDIGEATTAFARKQGASVKRVALEDYSPRLRRPEAIFIWNCFEQMDDPAATLKRSHELLDRDGLLILRVPNSSFYLRVRRQLEKRRSKEVVNALGYNNLLGFPYLHGFGLTTLQNMVRANGFQPIETESSSLLTPPYPYLSSAVCKEWNATNRLGEQANAHNAPWIELVSRRQE